MVDGEVKTSAWSPALMSSSKLTKIATAAALLAGGSVLAACGGGGGGGGRAFVSQKNAAIDFPRN